MQIHLRALAAASTFQTLERAGLMELVRGDRGDIHLDLAWADPASADFLRRAAALAKFDLNPWMEFTRGEIAAANYLLVRCRGVARDTDADFRRTREAINQLPWTGDDPSRRFRIPRQLFLSRLKLRPNQIAGVGEWTAEYIAATHVCAGFQEAGLSGLTGLPVYQTKSNQPFEGVVQLYCSSILPHRLIDVASLPIGSTRLPGRFRLDATEQAFHAWGCLCYSPAALAAASDFNRTGERMVAFEFPEWVVSQRVRSVYQARYFKGWAFAPVLEEGTELFDRYEALWRSLYKVLEECGVHTIRLERPWLVQRGPGA